MRKINTNAPIYCSKSIVINVAPGEVWAVLTDIDRWEMWQTNITGSHLTGELKSDSAFEWKSEGVKIHSILHTVESFKYFGWTGKTLGIFAIHNWTLTDLNGQTRVSVEESMEGIAARLFKKSLNKSLNDGMQLWLNLLKLECEKPAK